MAEANHYCATCKKHFRADPQNHIDVEHDGGAAQIIEDGTHEDWKRRKAYGLGLDIDDR